MIQLALLQFLKEIYFHQILHYVWIFSCLLWNEVIDRKAAGKTFVAGRRHPSLLIFGSAAYHENENFKRFHESKKYTIW